MPEPAPYRDQTRIQLFGKAYNVLDLSHEISDTMPVYPGHAKTATWWHLTHEECVLRLGDTPFEGYAVRGLVTCDHVSTHVDAIYHFNKHRSDLTVETIPLELMFTPAVWVDVSFVPGRTHITVEHLKRAVDQAEVTVQPGITFMYYTGISQKWSTDGATYVTQYPGLDGPATDWLLDRGVVNVCTDAASTDNPADITYPNHTRHGQRLVIHTENVANINRIPRHNDFYYAMFPLKLVGMTGSPIRALALWE